MLMLSAVKSSVTRRPTSSFHIPVADVHSPLQFIADTLFTIALGVAISAGYQLATRGLSSVPPEFVGASVVIALLFAAIGRLTTGQQSAALTTSFDRVQEAAWCWTAAFAGLVLMFFALKAGTAFSRGAILCFYVLGLPAITAWRVLTPVVLAPLAHRFGYAMRECIIVGDGADPQLDKIAREFQTDRGIAPRVIRFRAGCPLSQWTQELQHLSARIADTARLLGPGEVYVCAGAIPADRLSAVDRTLSILPRAIFVIPDAQTATLARCKAVSVGARVALEIRREPLGTVQRAIKRILDFTAALVGLVFLLPFFAVVALAIKADSHGPVFFRQARNGYQGKPFNIWKFRSMHVQENGPSIQQAQRDDPRVTRLGRFLRKYSIDELPQLINILAGEMSLVGPRPHAKAHDELYARSIEHYEVRQHVKPGLTGWAQVNGLRGETATLDAMYRRIEYDLWYAANATVFLDIEILVRTVIELLRHRNAY